MTTIVITSDTTTTSDDGYTTRSIEFTTGKRTPTVTVTDHAKYGRAYYVGGMSAHPAAIGKRFESLDAMCEHYSKSIGSALRTLFTEDEAADGEAEATIEQVAEAMTETEVWKSGWWHDQETCETLASGVRQGWLSRLSTTQIYWTEAGCELAKAALTA